MKAPVSWLRDLVTLPSDVTTAKLAEQFTAVGLTVERIESTESPVTGPLVVGRVLSHVDEPQKNGKTIRYCRVDVGGHNDPATDEFPASRGIVCGAHNFAEGDLVVVSLPGTVLPGNFEIAARKTYGHVSDGMIVSELELGLGEDHDGIIVLAPGSAEPGTQAQDILWSADEVLDIDVTPDLSYCLSLRGLAREAAIANGVTFEDTYRQPLPEPVEGGHPLVLESERCTSFVALTIEGIDPAASSPEWMAERLRASGVRSISLAVDVTNYVMLESGQPLHAYDGDKLQGPIRVRLAHEGERLTTLDGQDRALTTDDLLITDDSGPIGMAGVMGGENTEVSEGTTRIVLEAAHFEATSVSRTFRRHGLPSEASKRFERGVDPQLPYAAAKRAAKLLTTHGGGQVTAETVVGSAPVPHTVSLRSGLISDVLGTRIEQDETLRLLNAASIGVTALGDSLTVTAPSWRNDLVDPYDVVEEVGRHVGFDRIGMTLPVPPVTRGLDPAIRDRRAAMRAVAGLGFTEVLSLPFVSVDELDQLGVAEADPRRRLVKLANPLSETHSYLRTSLLPGLFTAVARNTSRSLPDLALFEKGRVFFDGGEPDAPRPGVATRPTEDELAALDAALPAQPETMAAVVTGNWKSAGWDGPAVVADWTHVVAFAEAAAAAVGVELERRNVEMAPWHPGRCAELSVNGIVLGHAGELHPRVVAAFRLPERSCAVEFNADLLLGHAVRGGDIEPMRSFPMAKEDVALIVDADIASVEVEAALAEGAGELLESIALFDVYTGDQVGEGKKSLAFALRFRADRTLTDAEAAAARQSAVKMAEERFGAVQRA
ncbi:phenylalanine--tRNA ligase subunit beta [Tessaracoccus sp. MC1865]|uniref:phenylalanine--tRNA ligase subunit beta n=1 Tax=Tessaracoccus sp. MC1865 TaxID=2760310 RepID=UPI0015FF4D8F|nr:phenylalanine--tRNA ligase subunit beta [Tessaracoccus sp. MC1865]MBB1484285.1 phenylalanine--tRNA ligase subunit beta [Tessaracoccus sp. MC1865]QTO38596.1 phenylalanine--tRNA ligase subunit beta [Tessaracoccus sp. MC1865]